MTSWRSNAMNVYRFRNIDVVSGHQVSTNSSPSGLQVVIFNISNHPRMMSDPTYCIPKDDITDDNDSDKDTHKDKYEDKDKYKMLKRPITCYIFEKQVVQGYQI